MIIKENLRPYGRLLNRYYLSLDLIKELQKGITKFNWKAIQQKFFSGLVKETNEQEIIKSLRELQSAFCLDKKTFSNYLKRAYGISKLPK